mgnify:CR=1 FL=1
MRDKIQVSRIIQKRYPGLAANFEMHGSEHSLDTRFVVSRPGDLSTDEGLSQDGINARHMASRFIENKFLNANPEFMRHLIPRLKDERLSQSMYSRHSNRPQD